MDRKYSVRLQDHWWQTELSFPGAGNAKGLGIITPKLGSVLPRSLDMVLKLWVMMEKSSYLIRLAHSQSNCFFLLARCPPFITMMTDTSKIISGYYDTMDAGMVDDDGYVSILSRTDDIINVSGIRLSTGARGDII